MKTIKIGVLCAAFFFSHRMAFAQSATAKAYQIPFGSQGNVIELAVANSSAVNAENVKVEVTNPPAWLKFARKDTTIALLKSKQEQSAGFIFSVDKTAPVNKDQTLSFTITAKTGESWTKEIKVKVGPPSTFALFQNYPNPFNPATIIEYQLPGTSTRFSVTLKIYDVVGREIAVLVNEQQEPGFYQKSFNASRFASGIYFYQLIANDEQDHTHVFRKKMVLVK